ncbi:MAG: aconitase family protein, partial [Mariprofundaceae bacterium]|nr:aconitase family protein [Mariprofundaceae bacterium]
MINSFDARNKLNVDGKEYVYYQLEAAGDTSHLPYSLKILLENLLRREDGINVTREDILALINRKPGDEPREIAYMPARVLMQDFTGVPAVVDLAAMRDAMANLGGDPAKINPLAPAELVIDHSVQVDNFASDDAAAKNTAIEFVRNEERYNFLKWGQNAFETFKVVPPGTGIVHQVNLENLARTVFVNDEDVAYPDTLIGTDSHTTMINGLGILGWGVGGIEAEAAMLGQPVSMLVPKVVGFELTGSLPEGALATDLVLTIVQMLRQHGVVGKFVEFYGSGLDTLPLADRATIANMAPEYGATCGIFPIDDETLNYLELTGRGAQIPLVKAYYQAQGMFREDNHNAAVYDESIGLDMTSVVPSISGPKRPQDRIVLSEAKTAFSKDVEIIKAEAGLHSKAIQTSIKGQNVTIKNGAVVIAAITSCTNTSNPT